MSKAGTIGSLDKGIFAPWKGPLKDVKDPVRARTAHVEKVGAEQWEAFAVAYADLNQEQTHQFNAARWGAERIEHAIVSENGEVLGGAVVILIEIPVLAYGLAIVKWGPLWRPLEGETDPANLREILRALKREYSEDRGYYLSIMPHTGPEHDETMVNALDDLDFDEGWAFPHPDRFLVNVSLSPEEIRKSLSGKWRSHLKKSQKSELDIRIVDAEEGYDAFMELYGQMLARKDFNDTSAIDTLPSLMESRQEAIRPVFVLAYHEGTPTG